MSLLLAYNSLVSPLLLAPFVFAPQAQSADQLVDSARKAVSVSKLASLKDEVIVSGKALSLGLDGSYIVRIGPGGKFVNDLRSPLGRKIGFDGKQLWEADRTGATRILDFGEADTQRLQSALETNAWLLPGAAKITLSPDGTLNVRLNGSEIDQQIRLDATTSLPTLATYESAAGKVEAHFENWKDTPAGKLPMKITWTEGGVEQRTDQSKVETAPVKPSDFEMPSWVARDTTFDSKIPSALETKRLASGHIIVKPTINGKDVGWFILDSGAEGMCVDKTVADELGLLKMGEVPAVGVGGVERVPFRPAREFSLGPVTIKNLVFVELDLAQIGKMLNLKLGGIVGYDVFRRSVVEMDVMKPQVSIYDPAGYKLQRGNWQQIKFEGGNIGVEASFEGDRKGWFRLDTGAAGTVSFHGPFVEKFKLLDGRQTQRASQGGVGGMQEAKSGKIDWFELAGHRFEKPTVTFSTTKVGAFHNFWLVGNIGQKFMDPFVMVFDYPESRMAFVPKG